MSATLDTTAPPHELIWATANAFVASQALQLTAELGVADHLADQPATAGELAVRSGTNPEALDRILRLLAAHGIFDFDGSRYRHTDASRLLRTDHPASMRAFAQLMGLPVSRASFDHLGHSVRTGAAGVEVIEPEGLFAYLRAHPDEAQIFDQAMTAKAHADIAGVLDAVDFGQFETIADIGGGRGHLLQAVLDTAPQTHGVLFDLPEVIATLNITNDRLQTQPGDFFTDPLPAADAYLLMDVIHDWNDIQTDAILRAIRWAAKPGANVLILEDILPDDVLDARSQALDVIMLAITGGQERTAAQLGELLQESGFRPSKIVDSSGRIRIAIGEADPTGAARLGKGR